MLRLDIMQNVNLIHEFFDKDILNCTFIASIPEQIHVNHNEKKEPKWF